MNAMKYNWSIRFLPIFQEDLPPTSYIVITQNTLNSPNHSNLYIKSNTTFPSFQFFKTNSLHPTYTQLSKAYTHTLPLSLHISQHKVTFWLSNYSYIQIQQVKHNLIIESNLTFPSFSFFKTNNLHPTYSLHVIYTVHQTLHTHLTSWNIDKYVIHPITTHQPT
jgi:hypothetical protein